MKEKFYSLTQRERVMVSLAAVVVVLFVFYLLIFEPVASTYTKNKKTVSTATQTLAWMTSAAEEVIALRGNAQGPVPTSSKQFVLSIVDKSAKKAGLGSVMKRVQPEGDSGVKIWFESASFDEFIKWLALLESRHSLVVKEINIDKTDAEGQVNVRVDLVSL